MYLFIRYLRPNARTCAKCGALGTQRQGETILPRGALGKGAARRRARGHMRCRPEGCWGTWDLSFGKGRAEVGPHVGQRHAGQRAAGQHWAETPGALCARAAVCCVPGVAGEAGAVGTGSWGVRGAAPEACISPGAAK